MTTWVRRTLRHAFAVDPSGPAEPTDAQRAAVDRVVELVVRRRMTAPALIALESCRNVNFLGGQLMHFLAPFAEVLVQAGSYRAFAEFLERRGSIDYLCQRIEEAEAAHRQRATDAGPET